MKKYKVLISTRIITDVLYDLDYDEALAIQEHTQESNNGTYAEIEEYDDESCSSDS